MLFMAEPSPCFLRLCQALQANVVSILQTSTVSQEQFATTNLLPAVIVKPGYIQFEVDCEQLDTLIM